jgi:hypothetical protein
MILPYSLGLLPMVRALNISLFGIGIGLLAVLPSTAADPPKPEPASSYTPFERHGFKIKVSSRVVQIDEAMRNLDKHLERTIQAIPEGFRSFARGVTIWVEPDDSARRAAGLKAASAAYIPSGYPTMQAVGYLPLKAGGIEVFSDVLFLSDYQSDYLSRSAPGWLVHEFAHAFHDRFLGFNHPEVKQVYKQAMERKLYESVKWRGLTLWGDTPVLRVKAYAATDALEYFAEVSSAYLDCATWYYPFSRQQLKDHDRAGFKLMESVWKTTQFTIRNDLGVPLSIWWVGENSRQHKLFDLMLKEQRTFDGWDRLKLVGENMFDGEELRFIRPKAGEVIWRLNAQTIAKKPRS